MDIAAFDEYLHTFPALRGAEAAFARRALGKVFLPPGTRGVDRSWLESSVPSATRVPARFIHYYTTKGGLTAPARLRVWDLAFARFTAFLAYAGRGGAAFSLPKARALRLALRQGLEKFSAVIVSAEWRPGAGAFSKATVYIVTEKPVSPAFSSALARIAEDGRAWTAEASAADMGFLGADFFPDGRVAFKVYRRYPAGSAVPEPFARRYGLELARLHCLKSVHRVYKYCGRTGRIFLDKLHFTLKRGVTAGFFAACGERPAAAAARALLRHAPAASAPTFFGVSPGGRSVEIYFG